MGPESSIAKILIGLWIVVIEKSRLLRSDSNRLLAHFGSMRQLQNRYYRNMTKNAKQTK